MATKQADLPGMIKNPVRLHKQLAMDGVGQVPKGTKPAQAKTSGYEKKTGKK